MRLEDLEIYRIALDIGNAIWDITLKWEYYTKDTIGKQIVRSADSIAANIAESYGRYHYKDIKNFCYYARGSLYETRAWLTIANNRNLFDQKSFENLTSVLNSLAIKLNNYIRTIGNAH